MIEFVFGESAEEAGWRLVWGGSREWWTGGSSGVEETGAVLMQSNHGMMKGRVQMTEVLVWMNRMSTYVAKMTAVTDNKEGWSSSLWEKVGFICGMSY